MKYQFARENIRKTYAMTNVEMEEFAAKLSDFDWKIFEIIVSNGISEEKMAKTFCVRGLIAQNEPCVSEDTVWRSIKFLVNINLFEVEKVVTGYRGFNILKLTSFGHMMFVHAFLKNPPLQEHEKIIKEHSSIHHGYMVLDLAEILRKKFGCNEVWTGRKENQITLGDGLSCIPDVVVRYNEHYDYFEVECGNHHLADMHDKLTKLARLNGRIFIVGQNREIVTGVLKKQVDSWVTYIGREKLFAKRKRLILTTITDLLHRRLTYVYNFEFDEPFYAIQRKRKEVTLDED